MARGGDGKMKLTAAGRPLWAKCSAAFPVVRCFCKVISRFEVSGGVMSSGGDGCEKEKGWGGRGNAGEVENEYARDSDLER